MEIVVCISGASGVGYGIRFLQVLHERGIVAHLVLSDSARKIIEIETDIKIEDVENLANFVYSPADFAASIASGSYIFDAMVVIPCSMGTLSAIASGSSDTLIARAADVCLKEKRRLIIVTRETPLSLVQLNNMVIAAQAGAIIMPACPAFYSKPKDLAELVDILISRVLDLCGIKNELCRRWEGNPYNRLNPSKKKGDYG